MYLSKNLLRAEYSHNSFDNNNLPIDFSKFIKMVDYYPYINATNQNLFNSFMNEQPSFIADQAAAYAAKLAANHLLGEKFVRVRLECCEQIIRSLGYEISYPGYLTTEGNNNINNIALVVGCQTKEIIEARAEKLVELMRTTQLEFNIVFSGKHPKSDKECDIRIPNEAGYMKIHFTQLLDKQQNSHLGTLKKEVALEQKSTNSVENINEFLNGNYLSTDKPNNVFIISSTFHLIRLSQIMEAAIFSTYSIPQINKIILVGAEEPGNPGDAAHLPAYIKSMEHSIYSFIFSNFKNIEKL